MGELQNWVDDGAVTGHLIRMLHEIARSGIVEIKWGLGLKCDLGLKSKQYAKPTQLS